MTKHSDPDKFFERLFGIGFVGIVLIVAGWTVFLGWLAWMLVEWITSH